MTSFLSDMTMVEKQVLSLICKYPQVYVLFNKDNFVSNPASYLFSILSKEIKDRELVESLSPAVVKSWLPAKEEDNITEIMHINSNLFMSEEDYKTYAYSLSYDLDKVKFIYTIKQKIKDINTSLNAFDLEKAQSILSTIQIRPEAKIETTDEVIKKSFTEMFLFETGTNIDNYIGKMQAGNMMAIAGEPGTMKTYYSMWLMFKILEKNKDFIGLYFEKEMSANDIALRVFCYIKGISITELQQHIIEKNKNAMTYNEKYQELLKRFIIIPQNQFHDVHDINRLLDKYKANVYCIDYIQQMVVDNDINRGVMHFMSGLKDVTIQRKAFGIILSQVNDKDVSKRVVRISKPTDMQYGSFIVQHCSQIVTLFYPQMLMKGLQPRLETKYLPTDYFIFIHKVRNAKDYSPYLCYKILPNGYFQDVGTTQELERMHAWIEKYQSKKEEKKNY